MAYSAVQSQNAVSAYFTIKQILPFGFAEQNCVLASKVLFFSNLPSVIIYDEATRKMILVAYPIKRRSMSASRDLCLMSGCNNTRLYSLPCLSL